jgi:hypothetical protein
MLAQKTRPTAWIRYCCDWTSAPYISLRSGMFKHPKVVPITAAKRESKESPRTETIPAIRTGIVTRMAIRQMLAAAGSHQTQALEERPRSPEWRARTRGKILLHAQAQLCRQLQQLATHFPLQNQKYARNTPLNALRRSISFALPEQRSRIPECSL